MSNKQWSAHVDWAYSRHLFFSQLLMETIGFVTNPYQKPTLLSVEEEGSILVLNELMVACLCDITGQAMLPVRIYLAQRCSSILRRSHAPYETSEQGHQLYWRTYSRPIFAWSLFPRSSSPQCHGQVLIHNSIDREGSISIPSRFWEPLCERGCVGTRLVHAIVATSLTQ